MRTDWKPVHTDVDELPDPSDADRILARVTHLGGGRWKWRAYDKDGHEHKGTTNSRASAVAECEKIVA